MIRSAEKRDPRPDLGLARPRVALGLAVLGALCGACTASSDYMRPVAHPQPLRPPAGQALVVFIRPSSFARAVGFTVIDEQGRFVGDSLPSTHFAVPAAPGRHYYIIWAENTATLQADVIAGKTYFVEVAPKMGALSSRGHLLAIKPRSESWGDLTEWLHDTDRLDVDTAGGQRYIGSRGEDTAERVRRGMEHWQEYDAEERAERTLGPGDGV